MQYAYMFFLLFSLWTYIFPNDLGSSQDIDVIDLIYGEREKQYMRPVYYNNYGLCGGYPYDVYILTGPSIPNVIKRFQDSSFECYVANFYIGCIYHLGIEIEIDHQKAIHFYEKSLNENYTSCCLNNLGALYIELGQFECAHKYLLIAAIQGSMHAIKNLADLYTIKGDEKMQFFLWEILAEKNSDSEAFRMIAEMYRQGKGTTKDIHWSERCLQFLDKKKKQEEVDNSRYCNFTYCWPHLTVRNKVVDISRIAGF